MAPPLNLHAFYHHHCYATLRGYKLGTEGSFLNDGIASGARAGDMAITRLSQRQNIRKSVYTH